MYQVLLGLPLLLCGLSAPALVSDQTQQVQVENQVQPKYASVSGDVVSFTADEVSFKFENLANSIINAINDETIGNYSFLYIEYNEIDYFLSTRYTAPFGGDNIEFYADANITQVPLALMVDNVSYGSDNVPNYCLFDYSDDNSLLTSGFRFFVDEAHQTLAYQNIMGALEQDIVANTSSMPSISDLFTPITQAITSFVGALGQAFSSVTALFWTTGENAGPTFLGLLVLIGVGVGLIYGAYRIIKGLMHRI